MVIEKNAWPKLEAWKILFCDEYKIVIPFICMSNHQGGICANNYEESS